MSDPLPHHSLPGRSLADYTGPWPVPRYWGLRPEESEIMRRYRRMTALIGFVIALLALPTFWLPNDVLTRHPGLRAFVLEGFGRLFPLIRVADTVGPYGQVMAVMWTVILIGSWGLLLPAAVRRTRYGFTHSDYSLVRWDIHDPSLGGMGGGIRTVTGKGTRQAVIWIVAFVGITMVWMLGDDFYGYLALLQGTSPAAAAHMHAGLGGLFTGWGYLHSALYRYFCRDRACVGSASRGILYVQEVTYTLFVWAISAMGTLGFLLLTHWDTVWAATRIDEQALDALWATRKRFRFGRRTG